jgi:hypothetical protein
MIVMNLEVAQPQDFPAWCVVEIGNAQRTSLIGWYERGPSATDASHVADIDVMDINKGNQNDRHCSDYRMFVRLW